MTKHHPVSLQVIRGALVFVGFTVGRIKRLDAAYSDSSLAEYAVAIEKTPYEAGNLCPRDITAMIDAAFAADVHCDSVRWDGWRWSAHISVDIGQEVKTASAQADA